MFNMILKLKPQRYICHSFNCCHIKGPKTNLPNKCFYPLSTGNIFNFNKECYELLKEFAVIAKQQLAVSEIFIAFCDILSIKN